MRLFSISMIAFIVLLAYVLRASADTMHVVELKLGVEGKDAFDVNASFIRILADRSYVVGQDGNMTVPLSVYRGKTLKRTIYAWVEDSNGKKASSEDKFPLSERFMHYDLVANFGFSGCLPGGDYRIHAEGLGLEQEKEVKLVFDGCEDEMVGVAGVYDGKVSYDMLDVPSAVSPGVPFRVRVVMRNPTPDDLEVDVWSYVYRHSVCYSGEREQNRKSVNLPSFSNVTFDLENVVDADDGEYNLKVKFLRSGRKTSEEITVPLYVGAGSQGSISDKGSAMGSLSVARTSGAETGDTSHKNESRRKLFSAEKKDGNRTSGTVFMSSSAKAGNLAVYFIMLVLALVLVALLMKRL